jgi:DNA-binding SARP family transcriptional activator
MLYISCLGQFRVQIDDQPVEIPSRPAQSLFAYLALNGYKVHRRERLAGLLWPDSTDENARGYLRQGLWRIRKSFETAGASWQDYLQIDEITVTFGKQGGISLDTDFLLQPKDGNRWTVEELIERVEVYGGELLPGFYDEWIILDRERLKSAYDHKMRLLLNQLEANQSWDDVLEWGERWIALGHVPEPAYRALMIAHAMRGDRSAVSAIYQRCEQALLEELGVPASKELLETYQQILNGIIPQLKDTYPQAIHEIAIEPPAPGVSPYKGLEFFDVEDAGLFFGRERLAARIVERLIDTGFLAVVGASGSGKSSIVRAGVVPSIRAARQAGNSPGAEKLKWQVGILTPTAHPLQAVSDLLGQSKDFPAELALDANRLDKTLRERSANRGGGRYLLVIDQFEEIFTLCENEWEREAFLENLLVAGRSGQSASAAVILVIRADFYAQCGRYPALRQVLSSQQEYIGPMTAGELRDAIEKPAAHEGWFIEPGLVDLILREVGREPGALPLLSHTLLETWKRRSGRWMTLKGYAESGGVHGAIARTAELVFNRQLSSEQQAVARQIFLRLTELGEDMSGTRRRAEASEFISGQAPAQLVEEVLNILAASRLITRAEGITEIAHEALIREWPALRGWLAEDREGLRLHHQLSEAARKWESLDRDKDELYRGARLAQAVEWAEDHWGHLNPIESEFLAASKAEEQRIQHEKEQQQQRELEAVRQLAAVEQQRAHEQLRSNRRLRFFAMGITLIFVVTLAAAWIAIEQRDRANRTIHLAHSRELAAAALNNLVLDPQLSILLALEAVKKAR